MQRRVATVLGFFILVGLLAGLTSCDMLGLGRRYTIQVRTYVDLWASIEYRESGTTDWISAAMFDEEGRVVLYVADGDPSYPDTAYFDMPGPGTYDFRARVTGGHFNVGNEEILEAEVEFYNSGSDLAYDYAHRLVISEAASIHGFN